MKFKSPIQFGVFLALVWIIIKIILLLMKVDDRWEIGVALNLLFVLIAIFFGIRYNHRTKEPPIIFPSDLKAAMRPAAIYTLVITAFVFAYYNYIDYGFIEDMRAQRMEDVVTSIDDAGGWEEFKESMKNENPGLEELSKEDFIDRQKETIQTIISPGSASTVTLIGLLVVSFMYSLIMAVLYRKVLVRMES